MSRSFVVLTASLAASAAATEVPTPGEQATLEEIVVTASMRGESASTLPVSLTLLDGETLRRAGVQHFQDVLGLVPNLHWSAGTSRPRYFQLRGIGELEQYQGAPNPSVGFLIDDIDFSGIGMPAMLFDVQQVEVLRGPQGTLYGANALAGIINVRTRDARAVPELRLEATTGEYGTAGAAAAAGGALDPNARGAWRLVAQHFDSDGSRHNAFLDRDDTNGHDETNLRGKLRWDVSEDLAIALTALHADLSNGYDAFSIDNSRVTLSDKPGRDAQRSQGAAMRLEYSGFEAFELRSITSWASSDIEYSFDGDWGNDRDWGAFAPYDFTQRFLRERRTVSQDLRLVSDPGAHPGVLAWTLGAYLLDTGETNEQLDRFNGDVFRALSSRYEALNTALYGDVEVPLTGRTRLALGARVERRDADYLDTDGADESAAATMLGGHVAVEYDLAPQRLLYATAARGYKAGGFNIGAAIPDERSTYDAEYLSSLEAGVKAVAADSRLHMELALFYMRRAEQQVATSVQLDPGDPLSFVFFTDNAARGENYGLELATKWRLAGERWQMSGALGILESRYMRYRFGERDLDGREQAHAPQYQMSLGVQYRHPLGFVTSVDAQAVDDFYFDASHDERANAFQLVNTKVGYETERWAAYAWARNLFDARYATRGFFFGNEPPDFASKRYVQNGDPRQLGLTVTYSFR
jgi:iron complex outermembrane recepter protein